MQSPTLFINIGKLIQLRDQLSQPLRGSEMSELPTLDNAWLLVDEGKIKDYGPMDDLPETNSPQTVDVQGNMMMPAWVDSHTHIVYAKSREEEFVMRIKGKSYEEIASSGGGILNSAIALQNCPEKELYRSALKRLKEVRSLGTGAIEIKSGYGLTTESEIKMLRVIRQLKNTFPEMPIKSTFLGAHAIPTAFKSRRKEFIKLITDEMIPRVGEEKLADYCDVFCERGFFTPEETDFILQAAEKYGMKAKVHANELAYSGGVQAGVRNNAISVDHLEFMGEDEINCMKNSSTIATLLPSTAFFLDLEYAEGRKLIDSGLPVALATDYNPGSTPSGRMPLVLSLACIKMKMTPEEVINAATINGAFAMEVDDQCGSISRGKLANLLILDAIPSIAFLPYAFGTDCIKEVYIAGKKVR